MQTKASLSEAALHSLKINFTQNGLQLNRLASWMKGRTQGFRLHLTLNRVFLFQVRLQINPVSTTTSLELVSLVEMPIKIESNQTFEPSIFLTIPTIASRLSKRPPSTLFNLILVAYSVLMPPKANLLNLAGSVCQVPRLIMRAFPQTGTIRLAVAPSVPENYPPVNGTRSDRMGTVCWHCPVRQAVFMCFYPDYSIYRH